MLQPTGAHAGNGIALEALRSGGALLLRHALTEPGIGDPPGFRLDDCSTQRNLSAGGRAQARAAGETLRAREVKIDAVYSSAWCRCIDTAKEMFPELGVDGRDELRRRAASTPRRRCFRNCRLRCCRR
jgi:broad specificity phosphatase PhoE